MNVELGRGPGQWPPECSDNRVCAATVLLSSSASLQSSSAGHATSYQWSISYHTRYLYFDGLIVEIEKLYNFEINIECDDVYR